MSGQSEMDRELLPHRTSSLSWSLHASREEADTRGCSESWLEHSENRELLCKCH